MHEDSSNNALSLHEDREMFFNFLMESDNVTVIFTSGLHMACKGLGWNISTLCACQSQFGKLPANNFVFEINKRVR